MVERFIFRVSYEENNDKSQLNPQVKMIGYNLFFADNRAHELGGAVSLSLAIEFYLENSLLKGNVCGYNGGGIFSTNVDHLSLYSCIFTNNIVDATDTKAMQASTSLRISIKQSDKEGYANKQASHFSARGGGAVSFMSDMRKGSLPMGATTNLHRDFKTVKCCFYKNSATQTGQTFGNGAGHEILFEGYVKYKSYKDYISGYNGEDLNRGAVSQYISRIIRGWDDNATIIQIDNRLTDPNSVCESISGSRHKKDEESSSVEMNEETITRFGESTTIPVTNENPLWTTSILGDKDDPFKDDFEETPEGGMFEANEDERSSD